MYDPEVLRGLLREWRALSELEGESIEGCDWLKVACCQRRKGALQPRITQAVQWARAEGGGSEMDMMVAPLIELEIRNRQRLAEQRQKLLDKQEALGKSSRALCRVRSAYSLRREALWNSFS